MSSLISETNWARRCVWRGYDIANLLPQQRLHAGNIDRREIPAEWIWPFLLSEAIEDEITLELRCVRCKLALPLDLSRFLRVAEPPKSLFQVRANGIWQAEACTGCSQRSSRYVALKN
ncbi:hypothetical protein ACFQ15_05380 [Sphingomonas hankookensis]|uniref:hypothetical protein n=1 Tax=Sphingomonas hankookensis TaxID=563996 RepID=UPI001F57DAB2|nr:hypothetical protein [Sphingomonas hankookensis]